MISLFSHQVLPLILSTYSLPLYVHAKSLQLCPTLCNPIDGSLPDSSVHGILQARILKWVAMPSFRGSSPLRDGTLESCPTLCNPMNRSMPGFPVHHQLPLVSSLKLTSIESVMPSSHLILCRPLLLLPPIPPSIRVFSNESILRMRWPKYWTFSFSW